MESRGERRPSIKLPIADAERERSILDAKDPAATSGSFALDGGSLGKGGDVTPFLDGQRVGAGRIDATVQMLFSADETTDVGSDTATPVSDDYGPKDSMFTGRVRWVQLDIDEAADDLDHLISPEERLQIAMARQ